MCRLHAQVASLPCACIVNWCILNLLCHVLVHVIIALLCLDVRISIQLNRNPGHLDCDITLLGILESHTQPVMHSSYPHAPACPACACAIMPARMHGQHSLLSALPQGIVLSGSLDACLESPTSSGITRAALMHPGCAYALTGDVQRTRGSPANVMLTAFLLS